MRWLIMLLFLFITCLKSQAVFTFYPLTNGVTYTNTMFMELWSGMVERCRAANLTSGLDYVRSYQAFIGYTNSIYAETNIAPGVTNIYSYTNSWPCYTNITLTNQWVGLSLNIAGTNVTIVPNLRQQDLTALDAKLLQFVSRPSFSSVGNYMNKNLADTSGTFNGWCASFQVGPTNVSTNILNTLSDAANLSATNVFQSLGIGQVTSVLTFVSTNVIATNWYAYFTDAQPTTSPSNNYYAIWESANAPTNWDLVLSGFSDTNLNGTFAYTGDACDDSGYDIAFAKYSAGGTAIIGIYVGFCNAGVVDYSYYYEFSGYGPELFPGGVIDYLNPTPEFFCNGFGDASDIWYPYLVSNQTAGTSIRTNFSYGFKKLRNENITGLNFSPATPVVVYRGDTSVSYSVNVTLQGFAFITNNLVNSNQIETVSLPGTGVREVASTRHWTYVTNVLVTGNPRPADVVIVNYPQPLVQAGEGLPYQFSYYHYNERAKYLDFLQWTYSDGQAFSPNATGNHVNARHIGTYMTCTWDNAKSQAAGTFYVASNEFTAIISKYTQAEVFADELEECAGDTNGFYQWEASWFTSWAYDYVTNYCSNITKTVDSYFQVNAVGEYAENGTGLGATGYVRRGVSPLSFSSTLSNNWGDTSFGVGEWVTPLTSDTNSTFGARTNKGISANTQIGHVNKWNFNYVLP